MQEKQKLSAITRKRLAALCDVVTERFSSGDWHTLGLHTGHLEEITKHDRLLRSLLFGDMDYEGHAAAMLFHIVESDPGNLELIEDFVASKYGEPASISTAPGRGKPIAFRPGVFEIPKDPPQGDLIAVMTPFSAPFEPVFDAIQRAATAAGYRAQRAKDIWEHSSVIQDVFSLIFRSHIVVCDFTGKNANVFYEAGIAHTLGKHVVPITQAAADVPFDLQHHRYQSYLNNAEGRVDLETALTQRFQALR